MLGCIVDYSGMVAVVKHFRHFYSNKFWLGLPVESVHVGLFRVLQVSSHSPKICTTMIGVGKLSHKYALCVGNRLGYLLC